MVLTQQSTSVSVSASGATCRCAAELCRSAAQQLYQKRAPITTSRQYHKMGHLVRKDAGRRQPTLICAFAPAAPGQNTRGVTFELPVDYSQLLGLRGRETYLESQITGAYETLASTELESGYSPRVQDGKLALLEEARAELRAVKGRVPPPSSPDAAPRGMVVEWGTLPGALALLAEVEEFELVLEVGARALEKYESRQFRRDILLSMALAHCGLAGEALESKGQVALGCARMEEARALLLDAGAPPLAPELEANIEKALEELRPQCILDHLTLPLGVEAGPTRRQAVSVLKGMLDGAARPAASPPAPPLDAEFAEQAVERLTAAETLALADWGELLREPPAWCTSELLERVGLAHLASGFAQRRPNLIKTAEKIFYTIRKDADVSVERSVCKLLLGAPLGAQTLLAEEAERPGLRGSAQDGAGSSAGGEEAGGSKAADAMGFVRMHSPGAGRDGSEDLLPGMCLFTERWLARVIFPSFADLAEKPPAESVSDYFQDSRVTGYLSMQGDQDTGALGALASAADDLVSSVQRAMHLPKLGKASDSMPRLDLPEGASGLTPRGSRANGFAALRSGEHPDWLFNVRFGAATLGLVGLAVVASNLRARYMAGTLPSVASVANGLESATDFLVGKPRRMEMNERTAEHVIRRWQSIKAEALGPRRNLGALAQILGDPLLSTLTNEAAKAKEAGWFWQYSLKSIKVEKVDLKSLPPASGGYAVVTAHVEEGADLFSVQGKHADSYSNPYTVEYKMRPHADGSWRIVGALILGK